MCWCTPSLRTPFCGKPGCARPVQKPAPAGEKMLPPAPEPNPYAPPAPNLQALLLILVEATQRGVLTDCSLTSQETLDHAGHGVRTITLKTVLEV